MVSFKCHQCVELRVCAAWHCAWCLYVPTRESERRAAIFAAVYRSSKVQEMVATKWMTAPSARCGRCSAAFAASSWPQDDRITKHSREIRNRQCAPNIFSCDKLAKFAMSSNVKLIKFQDSCLPRRTNITFPAPTLASAIPIRSYTLAAASCRLDEQRSAFAWGEKEGSASSTRMDEQTPCRRKLKRM